jgi:GNAT superfamily N-acetyltransferase
MRAGDDLDAELDLRHRAFGPMRGAHRQHWREEMLGRIAVGAQYGVWAGDRDDAPLIGSARYYRMRQYWHGRPVPMAGVGGVKVAPEARGRGVGRALMAELLGVLAHGGFALSVLFPATLQLYRSLGWELAGGRYRIEVPVRSLGSLLPPDPHVPATPGDAGPVAGGRLAGSAVTLRRVSPDDAEEVIAVLGAVHAAARDCGPATRDPASVRRWLGDPDLFGYLASDGFLGYGWHGDGHHEIMVNVLAAASPDTARALWGIVASHASVTRVVHAAVGPDDPIGWLTRERDVSLRREMHWMLRVLDPVAAIAGRGFPAAARASAALRLVDPDLPGNAGLYTLEVADGQGSVTSGITARDGGSLGLEPIALGPRGFAALYAGVPMATLRVAGLAAGGDPGRDGALDAAFAAQPYMLDYF